MLKLEIVTPEKKVADVEVDSVTIPTASGEIGVMPHHAPLISAMKPGILSYQGKGVSERIAVSGGFVEVSDDKVAVLVDKAEHAGEIDVEAARESRADAEKSIAAQAQAPVEEVASAREELEHADARLQLAAGK